MNSIMGWRAWKYMMHLISMGQYIKIPNSSDITIEILVVSATHEEEIVPAFYRYCYASAYGKDFTKVFSDRKAATSSHNAAAFFQLISQTIRETSVPFDEEKNGSDSKRSIS